MGFIQDIKNWAYQRSLRARIAKRRAAKGVNLDNAKTIAILFPADDVDQRKAIVRYADQLKKKGKKVRMLAYLSIADPNAKFAFPFFTKKQVDWAGRPKGEEVEVFLREAYDLLMVIQPASNRIFEYLSLLTDARMKIGPVPEHPEAYDLMIDTGPQMQPAQFIQQFEGILKKTNVKPTPIQV